MTGFDKLLLPIQPFSLAMRHIGAGETPMGIIGLQCSQQAHWISAACAQMGKKGLVICKDEAFALRLSEDLNAMGANALFYPQRSFNFSGAYAASGEYQQQRLGVLTKVLQGEFSHVVCTAASACQLTMPKNELERRLVTIDANVEYDTEELLKRLISCGYTRCEQVDGPGQFSLRGGILDVFSAQYESPVRVEFWGDSVDSISFFDVQTQRRTQPADSVTLTACREVLFDGERQFSEKLQQFAKSITGKGSVKLRENILKDAQYASNGLELAGADKYLGVAYERPHSLFDYLPLALTFVCITRDVKAQLSGYEKLLGEDLRLLTEQGRMNRQFGKFCLSFSELSELYTERGAIFMDTLSRGSFDVAVKSLVTVDVAQGFNWNGSLSVLTQELEQRPSAGTTVVFAGTEKAASALADDLEQQGISAVYHSEMPSDLSETSVNVLKGALSGGFTYQGAGLTVISCGGQAYGSASVKKSARASSIEKARRGGLDLSTVSRGDYVVHKNYGIGIFDGVVPQRVDGHKRDYIKINYRGSDVLLVPATELDLISKYAGANDAAVPVRLSRFGTDEWLKTKARVRKSVEDMAKQLTELYAKRMSLPGFAFEQDIDMQNDFERRFPYEETDDQLISVNQIKSDMEKPYPMDRLLCGDVGFGKTEVALRAAFKCIANGKQAAFLVPTTILAFQHYQTIARRFEGFPVEVEMLSRFKTAAEKAKIKRRLRSGAIDLVVGTHSLIAKSVEFKDLGLLIIDEEQRFGVAQKEKLKERFPLVDVLTLSATPIPRTLNMAMSGIRDMSVLEMPPLDRFPVQTYVVAYDVQLVTAAIERELRRGGQVYYLHNRVEDIEATANRLKSLLPQARIGVGHGMMKQEQLSEVWRSLLEGEIDVLVCTTIIETGVDVPNVNTLIIENADRMGLSQLHQIRGRVGRSARHAFAYFTYEKDKCLSEVAERRLSAIREFTQFGSGFQIAMRDLEIRGAGSLLGAQQHGHIEAVGYDLYMTLLSRAVQQLKQDGGQELKQEQPECVVDIKVDARIDEKYIESLSRRLEMYKRIALIRDENDVLDVLDEFIDRFGTPPAAVKSLTSIALIRSKAAQNGIYEISQRQDKLLFFTAAPLSQTASRLSADLRGRVMLSAMGSRQYIAVRLEKDEPTELALKVLGIIEKGDK